MYNLPSTRPVRPPTLVIWRRARERALQDRLSHATNISSSSPRAVAVPSGRRPTPLLDRIGGRLIAGPASLEPRRAA